MALLFLFLFQFLFVSGLNAQTSSVSNDFKVPLQGGPVDISEAVSVFAGEDGNTSPRDYLDLHYRKLVGRDLKANYSTQNIWIKINLENSSDQALERVVYLTSALVGRLELFDEHGSTQKVTGGAVPLVERTLKTRLPGFRIQLEPYAKKTFYIHRNSHHTLSTRFEISDLESFYENESSQKSYFFFYIGGITCLILFNFLIGLYAKDKGFLYYSGFAFTLGMTICVLYGVIDSYFLDGFQFVVSEYLMCFSALSALVALNFGFRFLNLSKYLPRARRLYQAIGFLALVVFCNGLMLNTPFFWDKMGYVTDFVVALTLVTLIVSGFLSLRKGGQMSKFFLMSWAFMFAGVGGYFGAIYGLLPSSNFFNHGLLFGSLVEMVVISLGLAYKLNILDIERRRALESAAEKEHYHRLVKVLSHDVSNAMMILSGYAVRLQRKIIDPEERPMLLKMNNTIQKMNEILGMVKKEEAFKSFKESIELKSVSLSDVVAEVLYFYQDRLDSKNLQTQVDVPLEFEVYADRTALAHQVISNIISNAIKFSKNGGLISIFVEEVEGTYRLVFKDEGIGIPKDHISKIFFSSQGFSTDGTKNEKGTGIGSSLIREYMTLFNGKIEVESSTDRDSNSKTGTRVILVFPKTSPELNA